MVNFVKKHARKIMHIKGKGIYLST